MNLSSGELYANRTRDQSLYMPNEVDSKLVFSCNSSVVIPAIDEQPRPTASEPDRGNANPEDQRYMDNAGEVLPVCIRE